MAGQLNGKRVAFLAADGVEQIELAEPLDAVKRAGAEVELISVSSAAVAGDRVERERGDDIRVSETELFAALIDEVEPMDGARMLMRSSRLEGIV